MRRSRNARRHRTPFVPFLRPFVRKLAGFVFALAAGTAAAEPHCPGRFPNPVTDVCWSCVFPIVVGTNVPLGKVPEDSYTPETDASALCVCGENVNVEGGVNLSFWEPLRTAEVVRHAWCSPTLGGVTLAKNSGITRSPDHGRGQNGRSTRFANVHWFVSPWLFVLEAASDISCLEQAPWDLAYLSELDPLWDDTIAGFLLAPDAALFANPAAQAACVADCLAANVKKPVETLYWCSGCRGGVFPGGRRRLRPGPPSGSFSPTALRSSSRAKACSGPPTARKASAGPTGARFCRRNTGRPSSCTPRARPTKRSSGPAVSRSGARPSFGTASKPTPRAARTARFFSSGTATAACERRSRAS